MAPHYCGCRSFRTWWAIMDQYKDFKEIQDLDHCSHDKHLSLLSTKIAQNYTLLSILIAKSPL